jgi:N-methylhydantoinase A
MADLIRKSTIEQGHDPRECVLVAYGGAGPTHAVFYGHEIGARAILVPRDSTVFSAEGMLTCDVTHTAETSRRTSTPFTEEDLHAINARFDELEERILSQFDAEGAERSDVSLARAVGMRFRRQVTTLDVHVDPRPLTGDDGDRLLEAFVERYAQVHGRGALLPGGGTDVEHYRVVGTRPIDPVAFPVHEDEGEDADASLKGERPAHFEGSGFVPTRVYDGDQLGAGNVVGGPAVIERMGDSVVVPPGYTAAVDGYLTLRLSAQSDVEDEGATARHAEISR